MQDLQGDGTLQRLHLWKRRLPPLVCGLALLAAAAAAEPKFTFVDLQPQANVKLADNLSRTLEGNHLGNVPQGEQKLGGTRWQIGEKFIHLRGQNVPDLPEKVEGIKVDASFDQLHILHSTEYGEGMEVPFAESTEIGAYVVHYADKSTEKIPIVYGEDLRDWWDWPDRTSLKRANVAWTGTNPAAESAQRQIRLFSVTWTNPHPDRTVATIDFQSSNTDCDPFLVALTLEKG